MMLDFRRRTRTGWTRPNVEEIRDKRLRGLDEFVKPAFAGRMGRVARRKKLEWWAMVATAFAVGGAIGWWLI
jgi:hypothetical protein